MPAELASGSHMYAPDLVLPKLMATRAPGWGWTGDVHSFIATYVLLGFIAAHVLAALYHYFVRRDRVLQRMLPNV